MRIQGKHLIAACVIAVLAVAGWWSKVTWFPSVSDECFQLDYERLSKAPANVLLLRPTHFASSRRSGVDVRRANWSRTAANSDGLRLMGRNVSLRQLMAAAYATSEADVVLPENSDTNRYDFLVTVKHQPQERFRELIHKQLGYVASQREHFKDVLYLTQVAVNLDSLRASTNLFSSGTKYKAGKLEMRHQPVQSIIPIIENACKKPVRDKTGLSGFYDFEIEWRRSGGDEPVTEESVIRSLGSMGLKLTSDAELMPALVVQRRR